LLGPWISGIARPVAREHRRSLQRDRHVLNCSDGSSGNPSARGIGRFDCLTLPVRSVVSECNSSIRPALMN
jgi:hypothetical protein